jgi:hypothetical protein
MMHRTLAPALLAGFALAAAVALAQEKETPDDSFPECLVITFRADKHEGSQIVETKVVPKLRETFGGKNVLFLTVDLTSRESRHQGKLLLNVVDKAECWENFGKTPGVVAIVDAFSGLPVTKIRNKDELQLAEKSIRKILGSDEPEAKSEDEDEASGCSIRFPVPSTLRSGSRGAMTGFSFEAWPAPRGRPRLFLLRPTE